MCVCGEWEVLGPLYKVLVLLWKKSVLKAFVKQIQGEDNEVWYASYWKLTYFIECFCLIILLRQRIWEASIPTKMCVGFLFHYVFIVSATTKEPHITFFMFPKPSVVIITEHHKAQFREEGPFPLFIF